jgi:hypothetical protein
MEAKMAQNKTPRPFGIQFLEAPSKDDLAHVNGGHHKKKQPPKFHSMDIMVPLPGSGGTTHTNT